MTSEPAPLTGPVLSEGVDIADLQDSKPLLGHVNGEAVILVRTGDEIHAVSGTCSHYGGPLAEGLVEGRTVRCPWHHACFELESGEAHAPGLNSIDCYDVERRAGRVYVLSKKPSRGRAKPATPLQRVVIVGGGAAGQYAAETLRREGYDGQITLLSADTASPVDRPNLSKDYLAGTAPEEWVPLRPPEFFGNERIELNLNSRVTAIDVAGRSVTTQAGTQYPYDALLLATGAEPVRLNVPGADSPKVHYLRSLDDCRRIIEQLPNTRRVVVIGASFIGLEVAAALRTRELAVHVVAPDRLPLERVMGPTIGEFVRKLHEEHGVVFHLGSHVDSIDADGVVLVDGTRLPCDLVVAGIGVRPNLELATQAGLSIDRGILVNEFLESSVPGIYVAGDIARWPEPHSGQTVRVEHWVVAQRQGELAARNMLGQRRSCDLVPFFWSQHYDVAISYVGHAERWDAVVESGSLTERDYTAVLRSGGKTLAVITIGRDLQSLKAEAAFERRDTAFLAQFA